MALRGSFSEKLQQAMAAQELGARTLARRLDPDNVEQTRRAVRRWLRGTTASRASRARLCVVLGLPEKSLDPDDDMELELLRELRETRARFERLEGLIQERVA